MKSLLITLAVCASVSAKETPNIVVIVADDLGYADVNRSPQPSEK